MSVQILWLQQLIQLQTQTAMVFKWEWWCPFYIRRAPHNGLEWLARAGKLRYSASYVPNAKSIELDADPKSPCLWRETDDGAEIVPLRMCQKTRHEAHFKSSNYKVCVLTGKGVGAVHSANRRPRCKATVKMYDTTDRLVSETTYYNYNTN